MANSITYDYRILDRYSRPLNKIAAATKKFQNHAKNAAAATKNLGNRFKETGGKMANMQSAVAALGAGAALKSVVSTTNDFQTALNNVEAITATTTENMKMLEAEAKRLGATTQFSASQAADAMGFLGMAGLDTKDIMAAMPGTLQLAAAGSLDLASAADIATNVMAQMGMDVSELGKVNDALAFTASKANTSVAEMAEGLKTVGATASTVGVDLNTTSALLGKLADVGVKGSEAGTFLRNAFLRLLRPTKKAKDTLKRLSINLKDFTTPDGKLKNFTGLIEKLKVSGATAGQIMNIFEQQGGQAILGLLKSGGPAIDELKTKIDNAGGAAERMAKVKMKGLPGAIKTLQSSFEGLIIAIGTKLSPIIEKLMNNLSALFSWLTTNAPGLVTFGAAVLGLGAAITALVPVVGIIISAMGTLMTIVGAITWPILAVVAGVAAASAAFAFWIKTGHPIITTLKDIGMMTWELIKPLFKLFGVVDAGSGIMAALGFVFKVIGFALNVALKPLQIFLTAITALYDTAVKLVDLDFKGAFSAFKGGGESILSKLGFGGGDDVAAAAKGASQSAMAPKTQNVNVGGEIVVAAQKGTEVVSTTPALDTGVNMRGI